LQAGSEPSAEEVRGFLFAFFETGTEGVIWSLLDHGLPGYDSLRPLRDGDELRVLDDAGGTLWEGVVRLDRTTGRLPRYAGGEPVQQAVLGYWVHGLQEGMDPEAWGRMFFEERRAVLREVGAWHPSSERHPFSGPAEGLRAGLATLPEARAREVFRGALYRWLFVRSDGEWSSRIQDWGLGLDETLGLLVHIAPGDARARAPRPNRNREALLPFSRPLLDLPFGVRTEGVRRVLEAARACLDDGGERG